VIGVPDRRLGEQVCAWIKLKDGETATPEEIKQFCNKKVGKEVGIKCKTLLKDNTLAIKIFLVIFRLLISRFLTTYSSSRTIQ